MSRLEHIAYIFVRCSFTMYLEWGGGRVLDSCLCQFATVTEEQIFILLAFFVCDGTGGHYLANKPSACRKETSCIKLRLPVILCLQTSVFFKLYTESEKLV